MKQGMELLSCAGSLYVHVLIVISIYLTIIIVGSKTPWRRCWSWGFTWKGNTFQAHEKQMLAPLPRIALVQVYGIFHPLLLASLPILIDGFLAEGAFFSRLFICIVKLPPSRGWFTLLEFRLCIRSTTETHPFRRYSILVTRSPQLLPLTSAFILVRLERAPLSAQTSLKRVSSIFPPNFSVFHNF